MTNSVNRSRFIMMILAAFIIPAIISLAVTWGLSLSDDVSFLVGMAIGGFGMPAIMCSSMEWWQPTVF